MTHLALRVEQMSKQYRIGQLQPYQSLREALVQSVQRPLAKLRSRRNGQEAAAGKTIWALKDVSFEVQHGEVVGIIGRNGAGKSTLLKILSRITEPTTGRVEGYGRVGSLLEVGTGFHPELTGRENLYLNGAILGMRRSEIERKFDEIVAFAELEQFLDTPVKRYSSGMYMRLAFAVAAHLEPEILIVDEVLAVGDVAFQKKCLGKMDEVARAGRTVLFVSHNMTAVENLCNLVIWIDSGQVVEEGAPAGVIAHYLNSSYSTATECIWRDRAEAPGNDEIRLRRACVRPLHGTSAEPLTVHDTLVVEFEYWNQQTAAHLDLSIQLYNEQGALVFDVGRAIRPAWPENQLPLALLRDRCHIPGNLLNDGMYRIELVVSKEQRAIYRHPDLLVFDIQDSAERRNGWYGKWPGTIRPVLAWTTEMVEESQSSVDRQSITNADSG
ncbi:MAG: ABC transporter ATP-binding protein [Chloroflexi bacterium]|nr:MAG: ABC transporter ATP-binding protein [Chloroflexota bacterium]